MRIMFDSIRKGRQKRSLGDILKSAFTNTAGLARVTPEYVEVDRTWRRPEFHKGTVRPSVALTARGNVALSRLPVVTEEEMQARKENVLAYDFNR